MDEKTKESIGSVCHEMWSLWVKTNLIDNNSPVFLDLPDPKRAALLGLAEANYNQLPEESKGFYKELVGRLAGILDNKDSSLVAFNAREFGQVFINPQSIQYIMEWAGGSRIFFQGEGRKIDVLDSPDYVAEKIRKG